MTNSFQHVLSAINTPLITGSIGTTAIACLPSLERACMDGSIAFPALKVLNLVAISLSFFAATQPGRLDGYQPDSKENPNKEVTEFMSLRRGGTLVAPKGWAFIIWAPIFLGEFIFATTSMLAVRQGTVVAALLQKVSGGFIMAQVFQTLWAASFRPKYIGADKGVSTWISAAMLTGIAACLNRSHAAHAVIEKSALQNLIYFLPISLHFGWTTAAALVNWNGNLAVTVDSPRALAVAGWVSVVAATAIGVVLTLQRSAPVYGGVICWALSACADGMSDRLDERNRLIANENKSNRFNKPSSIDKILNRKGIFGAASQKWLCTAGAVLSGAAAVWTTIQPRQP
jgi:hypothetical protein